MKINKDKWIDWLEVKGISPSTINNYCFYLERFDINKLSQDYCISFLKRYHNLPTPRSFISNILKYIIKNDFPPELQDIALRVDIPRSKTRKPKKDINVLSIGEINMIKEIMPSIKYKLMLMISFYCGLRASELVGSKKYNIEGLKPFDFQWDFWLENQDKFCPLVVKGKWSKRRKVYVPPHVAKALRKWINEEFAIKMGLSKQDKLFQMGVRRWEQILGKYSYKSLGRRINPHLLRHSCANYLRQKGRDLEEIRMYLGHESIKTTQTYLHLTNPELEKGITDAFS